MVDTAPIALAALLAPADFGLIVLPGCFFGPGCERHLRIAHAALDPRDHAAVAERLDRYARSPEARQRR